MGRRGELTDDSQNSSSLLTPMKQGYIRNFAGLLTTHTYIGSCETDVSEASMRAGDSVPRFVTIVRDPGDTSKHIDSLAWVHVNVVPLVSEDAQQVQQHYSWRGSSGQDSGGGTGPFFTPKMHEDGDGEIAVCTSTPLVSGDDHHAAYLPQWLAFQKSIGVSKVFVYLLDPGPAEIKILEHYEKQGLVETWNFRLSRYLMKREHLTNSQDCGRSGEYQRTSAAEHGGQQWLQCTNIWKIEVYWWGQLANTVHCHYRQVKGYDKILVRCFLSPQPMLYKRIGLC